MRNIVLVLLLCISSGVSGINADLEIIRKRFIDQEMRPEIDPESVLRIMNTIREDGSWPGIDYEDVSNTGFQHATHLAYMVELSRAYRKEGSPLKGDVKLKACIGKSLDFWLANDFICENWWWNQIGTPMRLVSMLLIMDEDLTPERQEKTLAIAGRANLDASGARPSGDRIKIAGILAKTLLLKRDEVKFNEVVRVIEGEIKFSTERGMQYDYSFHHRVDRVNNTLSYGTDYADAFAEWAALVAGTKYQFAEKSVKQLTDYYLDGICKMLIFGKYPDPGAKNRGITRVDALHAYGTSTPERLLKAGNYRKAELEEMIRIREGLSKPGLAHSTFFWQSEHFTCQRPGWFTSVRMYSVRNHNMEVPYNGEGLFNHHLPDGCNFISRTGDEYLNIFPVFDWQKIPGTTVVQKPSLPSEKEIQKPGLTEFVGAVTDGLYGAAVFDFQSPHDPLKAKKTWFFFDKEYVCLGAGIESSSGLPVATTLNQCLLRGDVIVSRMNKRTVEEPGERQMTGVKWIYHDGVGYLFPEPASVNLTNQSAKGSWFLINCQSDSPKEEISQGVFKLWFDHGSEPINASYQYVILPSVTEKEMYRIKDNRSIEILANSSRLQAVRHHALNRTQIVFYQPGRIGIAEGVFLEIDSPGLVMVRTEGKAIKQISVSDPLRKLKKIHLTISSKLEKKLDGFESVWNEEKGISDLLIDLPESVYAGKSVTVNL